MKNTKEYFYDFCIMDDFFMTEFFKEHSCVELIIKTITGLSNLKIKTVQTQYNINNFHGHSVVLDVYAVDEQGKQYDIEIQRLNKGASAQRARYIASAIDSNSLPKNSEYNKLTETYVIFITENDVFEAGLPIYHVERVIKECNIDFNDGIHIIYVNTSYNEISSNSELSYLIHDLKCSRADNMHYQVLADRMRFFKETQEGEHIMSEFTKKLINEGKAEGLAEGLAKGLAKGKAEGMAEGIAKTQLKVAEQMLKLGKLNLTEISTYTMLSIDKIKELANKLNIPCKS